jgi:hypothetical protein
MDKTPTELWQVCFDLTGCYFSGVPLSAPVSIGDNVRIQSKGNQGDCWAGVAVEAEKDEALGKKERVAKQTIAEIANIYALVSGFSIHSTSSGSNGIQSRDDLGKPPVLSGTLRLETIYPKERLEQLQRELMDKWERTRVLWTKMHERLQEKNGQFLRIALFYHYQSGLAPAVPLEEAFVDAAIGLEALYNESPQDIGYKLALRGALVLSCLGEKVNHFETLKGLYNLRNNVVHGKGETIEYAQLSKIKELLRKSIKACLALGLEMNKPEIIELIDQAMIESNARDKLEREIEQQGAALFT